MLSSSSSLLTGMNTSSSNLESSSNNFQMGLEAEAMSFLITLKKGVHSTVVSQQIQSIVRFTDLITEYPLPIIANSALLKLADVFRDCNNNFVRYWIVSVFEEVKGELLKVLNHDELIKRISAVLGSNDPIARSLALRMFGHMADILSDRTDLHHHIEKNLLTCIEGYERESCIVAIEQICSTSKHFASQILPQLETLLSDIKTPPHAKLSLIRVLRYMHTDVNTVNRTFRLCSEVLLKTYPTTPFILVILDTVTQLTQNSIFIAKDTFQLLFNVFKYESRKKVKISAINNITSLSKTLSDTYTFEFPFDMLQDALNNSSFDSVKLSVLRLLSSLSYSPFNVKKWLKYSDANNIIHVVELLLFYRNLQISDLAFEILVNAARHSNESEEVLEPLLSTLLRAFCSSVTYRVSNNDNLLHVKKLCEYIVRFVKSFSNKSSIITKTIIGDIEKMCNCLNSNSQPEKIQFFKSSSIYFSKCLLKYSNYCPNSVKDLLPSIYNIAMISNLPDDIVVNLCGVIFHTLYINKQKGFNFDFSTKIIDFLFEQKRYWCLYLLAREAMVYSHHSLSVIIFEKIEDKVECETNAFYLKSLRLLSTSETSLNTTDNNSTTTQKKEVSSLGLEKCKKLLDETLIHLKASGVNNCGFQISWISLRKKFIETVNNFIHHLANHNKSSSVNDTIFHHQAQVFISLNEKFNDMINSFFEIDHNSAKVLSLQSLMCRVLAKSISTILITQNISHPVFSKIIQSTTVDSKLDPLYVQCEHILSQLEKYEHHKKKKSDTTLIIHQILKELLRISSPIPQFFFSTTSNTALKLEIEINNNHNIFNRPINGILGQGLVIKFSGYITQRKHTQRKVKAIYLTIEKRLITSDLMNTLQPIQQENVQNFIVPVIEQSFQKKCICHFNTEGRYQLIIKTQMIDENDCYVWWSSNLANSDSISYGSDERKHISILVDVKPYQPTAFRSAMLN